MMEYVEGQKQKKPSVREMVGKTGRFRVKNIEKSNLIPLEVTREPTPFLPYSLIGSVIRE